MKKHWTSVRVEVKGSVHPKCQICSHVKKQNVTFWREVLGLQIQTLWINVRPELPTQSVSIWRSQEETHWLIILLQEVTRCCFNCGGLFVLRCSSLRFPSPSPLWCTKYFKVFIEYCPNKNGSQWGQWFTQSNRDPVWGKKHLNAVSTTN